MLHKYVGGFPKRSIDTKVEDRLFRVVCVQLHFPGHASDTSVY
jgi:hypothetical protein